MRQEHRPAKHVSKLKAMSTAITALVIVLGYVLTSPPRSSAGGNAQGKIAFTRGSGTAEEIYVMNADGSAQTRVTKNAVRDYFPVISPNGAKIAFESLRNGNRDIYVIDPDGSNEQRLTTVPGEDLHPAWSPDGKQIAFSSDQNGNRDIYVINANGSNQRRVTTHSGPDLHPVYSLDGTTFLFASVRDGDREIFKIGSDVTEDEDTPPLRLTDNTAFDSFPAWSPDGTKIVFHSSRDGNFEIYVMGINGENQTNLTRSSTEDIFPNWSPDGTKIVFESPRGGNRDIYVMDANGSNQTRLTTDAAPDLIPSWHWERTTTPKTISGRVVTISGGAVSGLKINVRRIVDAAANCAASNTFVTTLTDGTYSVPVTPGCSYRVEPDDDDLERLFGQDGLASPNSITVFVAFNVPAVNFVAGLIPTPSITGRIIDAVRCPNYNPLTDDGLECGLPGVTVTGEWTGETRTDVSRPIANTDASISGRYTLPNFLTNSVVRVRAFLAGYVITIIPPNTEQITLTNVARPLVDFKAVRANSNPAVSLTDPANGTTFPPAPQITINANASDADGSVSRVEFFQGGTRLGQDADSIGPYTFTWNGVAPGNYSLTAVATDNGGASTTSSPVNITVNEPPMTIQFTSATYNLAENGVTASVVVSRSGNSQGSATVTFTTGDAAGLVNCNLLNTGAASSRCDYETTIGTLRFAASETSKTISIPVIDDSYFDGSESFTVTLSSPTGATLGSPSVATVTIADNDTANGPNPIDQPGFFVRLHYIDFLNREPDASGLGFWTNQITSCGTDTACIELRRINVSAAFFISIEFQETGYLVYRIYKAAYGNLPGGAPVPVRFNEFLPDTQQIGLGVVVGQPGSEQVLESNKIAFVAEFVARLRFTTAYPTTLTPAQFVDALLGNAGVSLPGPERQAIIDEFGAMATDTSDAAARARVLRRVAEHSLLMQQEFNKAFVLMQYYGYLRRNPNDPPEPTLDFQGYNFWLSKLNQFNGNFIGAEMVKAFILSGEYQQRFGP